MRKYLVVLTLLAACGGPRKSVAGPPVPVDGSARELRLLVGDWEGEFGSSGDSRRGEIAFSLRQVGDTAYGRVTLQGPTPPPGCTDPLAQATAPPAVGEIQLTLGRINVGGPSVGGWLRPYRDPERGCWMDTWFEGVIRGDSLDGMYFSRPSDSAGSVRLGTWWVARRR